MVDERPYGHQLRQFSDPAIVIRVKMRDEQVVDLPDSRVVRGGNDPVSITRLMWITQAEGRTIASKSRIDQ